MRIVQVSNTLATRDGGPARNAFELNLALNALPDIEADLFSVSGDLATSVVSGHIARGGQLPTPGPRSIGGKTDADARRLSAAAFIRCCLAADVVIIHGYFLWWAPPLALILNIAGVPFVVTPHGSLTRHQQASSAGRKRIFEAFTASVYRRRARGFVTGSDVEANELMNHFPQSKVCVGGVGTAIPQRYKTGVPAGNPLVLLMVARIAEKKRIDLALRALGELRNKGHSVHLVIAGDGEQSLINKLRDLAKELGVERSVSWKGHVEGEEKDRLFLGADVFLMPSDDENFGIGLAEATSFGLPSVSSTSVASAAALPSTFCRTISDPTGASIAVAVLALVGDGFSERQHLARRAALVTFSWEQAAQRWIEALRKMM